MNLVNDAWIRVRLQDNRFTTYGLKDLFQNLDNIMFINESAIVRMSLIRMLVCISQAAIDGPDNMEEWTRIKDTFKDSAIEYINNKVDLFDLYGDRAFMQVPSIENTDWEKGICVSQLNIQSQTASRSDDCINSRPYKPEDISDANIAKNLITFHTFTSGGTAQPITWGEKLGNYQVRGVGTDRNMTKLIGNTLKETIHMNMIFKENLPFLGYSNPEESWGKPVWETQPSSVNDEEFAKNAYKTYLGRMCSWSCILKIDRETKRFVSGTTICPELRKQVNGNILVKEPETVVRKNYKGEERYFALRKGSYAWKDLGAVINTYDDQAKTNLHIRQLREMANEISSPYIVLWSVQANFMNRKTKLFDIDEWIGVMPKNIRERSSIDKYIKSCKFMDEIGRILLEKINLYFKRIKSNRDTSQGYNPLTEFWSKMDNKYKILIELIEDNSENAIENLKIKWVSPVIRTALQIFDSICGKSSARDIRAYVQAKNSLNRDIVNLRDKFIQS